MQTDTVSMKQFCTDNKITMTANRVDTNPYMNDANMDHWVVTIRRTSGSVKRAMTTYFSMGYGHNGKAPEAADVLDCLASDAASVDNAQSFEDWASDFGYDADSRTAEKTYKACEHGAARLHKFLGDDLYQTLLYGTERL